MSNVEHRRQIDGLLKVLEISRSMAATQDLNGLLQLVIERSIELLEAERATIFLYDADSDELVSRIAAGTGEIRIPAGSGLAGVAAKSGRVVNVPDAYADRRFNPDVDRRTGFKTRNILSVPMSDYHGSLVGVLQVLNKRRGSFSDHDIELAETFAAQAGVAIQRANLIEHFLLKQQMERAMRIAQDIQKGLLPAGAPVIDGFEIAGFSEPADQTGGDTYDFMQLPDGQWMFVVADATGHGVGPAILIAETRAMLRAICLQGADLSNVLDTANDLLIADLSDGRFVTCFLGLLDPVRSTLTYASAGHGPIIFYDRRGDRFDVVGATSVPLGVIEQAGYADTVSRAMSSGDFAAILTDGFIEAVDNGGEQFGIERTCEVLRRNRKLPAAGMIEQLHHAVRQFSAGLPQADDLTAVIIRKT